jgi:FkbM family methyltransferase
MKKISLFILLFFDYFHKKKIINFIKRKIDKALSIIDVGAHHGESIKFFNKNFKILNIYAFEPSPESFKNLIINTNYLIKKKKINFMAYNLGLGSSNQKQFLNISLETSSSTINSINKKSNYYQKKIKFLGEMNKDFFYKKEEITITTLDKAMLKMLNINCGAIDLIKIDTEGYEYEVLKGGVELLKKTKLILFEHHYDNMIIKNYTFQKINNFLIQNSFKKVFKAKMPFRKTFDYIYENTRKF